jgi:ATP-dependent DNA helicase RecQ
VCAGPRFAGSLDPALVEAAGRHLRSTPIELEVKKMAPDPAGTMRKIPENVRVESGWALARFGDGGWWPAIERGLRAGEFEDDVVAALSDLVTRAGADWVTCVPSVSLGHRLERLAESLPVPHLDLVERVADRPPQREMANATQQAANVRGAFRIVGRPPAGVGVLLDDRRLSGWTLAMVGGQLRRAGAAGVIPVALATLN